VQSDDSDSKTGQTGEAGEANKAGEPVRIATLGDMVLDVLVTGELGAVRDEAGAVRVAPGGSAANFAAIAARRGARVTFFGRVGDDAAGRMLVAELARDGVDARVRVTPSAATGTVLVSIDARGASRMISDPGASAGLSPEDLDAAALRAADLVHVSGYTWLRKGPAAAARAAVREVREHGAKALPALVTFDPGPAHLITAYGGDRLLADVAHEGFDVLFPNVEEGTAMTGQREPGAIVDALASVAPIVVLKAGADGCLVAWEGRVEHVPAAPAIVVDTTGAGDAFAAGFAVAFVQTRDPLAAARGGTAAAAAIVARVGSR